LLKETTIVVALNEREQQALNIIRALPPDRQRLLLYELAKNSEEQWRLNCDYAEQRLRDIAAQRGMDWGQMSDEERQDLVCEPEKG
jgi:hypothetical protein